jgi:PBP1b-binding outer membrane lipoprotein LpoB
MTRTAKMACSALLLTACLNAGCVDRVTDSAKDAFSTLTQAAIESVAIAMLQAVVPGFVPPPQQRIGLFPPP